MCYECNQKDNQKQHLGEIQLETREGLKNVAKNLTKREGKGS